MQKIQLGNVNTASSASTKPAAQPLNEAQPNDISKTGGLSKQAKIQDDSFQLTQRLVSAASQFAVQQVIADAYKSLTSALMAAATSKGKDAETARSIVKKLQKLISRAGRKMKELGEEDLLTTKKRKAEKIKQEQRAEEIKAELKRKRTERKIRERGYLRENGSEEDSAAIDAQLSIQAMSIAAAESAASASVDAGGDMGLPEGGSAVAAEGSGGEVVEGVDVVV